MANKQINYKKELHQMKIEFGLLQKIPCNKIDNEAYNKILNNGDSLPENVYQYENTDISESEALFYTVQETDLTESEIDQYLKLKKLSYIKTIKNCVLFFTALTIISIAVWFLVFLSNM